MNADGGFPLPTRRRRSTLHFVPLVDVLIILLMVFLLIAQSGQSASSDGRAHYARDQNKGISERVIRLFSDGTLTLDGQQADIARLSGLLKAEGSDAAKTVILQPEGGVRLNSLKDALLAVQSVHGLSLRIVVPADNESGDTR